ncbi:MAG: protein kinase domain-containing protein [Gemmatirosa sp.]
MQPTATPPLDPEIVALEAVLRGRFVVERELGRGGMGIVVLARDLALDRLVAIKVLPSPLSRQPHLRERFLREARTAAGLSHPNVVPIHAVEEHGDVVFFVMGFVDGETLARRVARGGPLPPAEATRVLRDVTWALAYAHGRGVIHRDVKPDNILLDRASGRALVTDFGIARVADAPSSLTLDGHVMGTAQYMSPEQAAGEAIDGRSDLYALGAVGFVALTGRPPFVAKSVPALLAMQVMQDAPPVASLRPDVLPRLAALVDRCLAKRPEDRFPSAEALAAALDEAGGTPPVVAPHLRNFVRMAEQSTMALTTMAPLMLVGIDARGRGSGAALGLLAAFIAIGAGLLRRARDLLLQGFGAGDVMRAFVLEQDARADEVAALYHGENGARLRRTRNVALAWGALLAVVWLFALAAANDAYPTPGTERTIARWIASIPLLLAMAALIVGVNSSERAERRSGALAGRLWRGRFTLYFFRLAGWGLDRPVAAPSGTAIDDGPSLPDVAVARHPELPRLLRDAHDNARALAEREARIVRVLAESGAADDGVPATGGPTTRAELVSRRVSLVAELRASLDAARAQRADVLAASENVRIQLARVRAGLADADDLAPDLLELRALLAAAPAGEPRALREPTPV